MNDASSARICFVVERQVGIGSAARALEPHARARPDVTWVDVTYWKENGLLERLPLPGRSVVRGFLQAGSGLRRGPFDALFFLTQNPAVLRPLTLARTPSVLWTDVTPIQLDAQAHLYGHEVARSRLGRFVKHQLVSGAMRRAALCVGWSEWARQSFVRDYGVDAENTAVVAPGINLSEWPVSPLRTSSAALPRLLFVGGDFVRKGGDLLLEVFRSHLRGHCLLDVVTRDPVIEEPGVDVHRGLTPDSPRLRQLYADASAFVLPTRGDCFSIATIEAMATGLPVVVSGIAGIPEIVEPHKSGYLVPPDDGASLQAALTAVIADPVRARSMGAYGRSLVEQRFDARITANRIFDLLASIRRHRRETSRV